METQEVRFKQWSWSGESLDSSKTLWREYGNRDTYYLKILRIFYLEGPTQYEEIGTDHLVSVVVRLENRNEICIPYRYVKSVRTQ